MKKVRFTAETSKQEQDEEGLELSEKRDGKAEEDSEILTSPAIIVAKELHQQERTLDDEGLELDDNETLKRRKEAVSAIVAAREWLKSYQPTSDEKIPKPFLGTLFGFSPKQENLDKKIQRRKEFLEKFQEKTLEVKYIIELLLKDNELRNSAWLMEGICDCYRNNMKITRNKKDVVIVKELSDRPQISSAKSLIKYILHICLEQTPQSPKIIAQCLDALIEVRFVTEQARLLIAMEFFRDLLQKDKTMVTAIIEKVKETSKLLCLLMDNQLFLNLLIAHMPHPLFVEVIAEKIKSGWSRCPSKLVDTIIVYDLVNNNPIPKIVYCLNYLNKDNKHHHTLNIIVDIFSQIKEKDNSDLLKAVQHQTATNTQLLLVHTLKITADPASEQCLVIAYTSLQISMGTLLLELQKESGNNFVNILKECHLYSYALQVKLYLRSLLIIVNNSNFVKSRQMITSVIENILEAYAQKIETSTPKSEKNCNERMQNMDQWVKAWLEEYYLPSYGWGGHYPEHHEIAMQAYATAYQAIVSSHSWITNTVASNENIAVPQP